MFGIENFLEHAALHAAGDDRRNARRGSLFGGGKFAGNAAGAGRAHTRAADRLAQAARLANERNQLSIFMDPRILVVDTLDIAQDHQQIGFEKRRYQGRQMIVVAELHLLDGHGVILVDDRNDRRLRAASEKYAWR